MILQNRKFLNNELVYLLEKYKLKPAELAKRLKIQSTMVYALKNERRTLGEELFLKILRKGFRLPEKEVRRIFTKAVNEKYLDDPELKS